MADEQTPETPEPEAQAAPEEAVEAAETEAETPAAESLEPETPAAESPEPEAPAAEAPAAAEAPEPEAPLTPKERRRRARAVKATAQPTRPPRSPEERQSERAAERRRNRERRRTGRLRAREKARARAGEARQTPPREHEPGKQKTRQGVVVSDRAEKTITVRIDTARRHRRYDKIVRTSRTLHAHDERGEAGIGDTVIVREARPLSRTKRWRLVRVVEKAE